jgi:superfamily II DNA or RNA helicase
MEITILDAIECEVLKKDGMKLIPCLSFESSYWVQGPHKKSRKTYQKQVFSFKGKRLWRFYTGLLPRILKWCEEHDIAVTLEGSEFIIEKQNKPKLKGITFRDDQIRLINAACKHGRGVIHSPTGTGKTIMQLGIISCYPDCHTLILAHTTAIVKQTFEQLKKFNFKKIEMFGGGNKAQKPTARITVSTMQSFIKIDPNDYADYYDIVIIDECLSPDTEILTDSGWKFIKDLGDEQVAQYNQATRETSFIKPTKKIEKYFDGDLINFSTKKYIDLLGTPNHEQPYFLNITNGQKRASFHKWKASGNHSIPIAGFIRNGRILTAKDRFKIMTAADGHITAKAAKNHQIVQFSFSKDRKIQRFFYLMSLCKYKFTEVKGKPKTGNVKAKRRFLVRAPLTITKNLKDICPLPEVSTEFGTEFIKELLQWDGSTKYVMYWSGTNKEDADYIQSICALVGITASHTIQIDNRKPQYNDVHRMVFVLKDTVGCQQVKKTNIPYKGMVYCVRVPDGNIITRRNNKVVITGNCHHVQKMDSTYTKILSKMLAPIRLGFTATKRTTAEAVLVNEGLLGPTLEQVTTKEAADLGILAKPELKLIKAECSQNILDIRNFQDSYEKIRINGKLVNGERTKVGVYTYGITENHKRNRQIAEILKDFVEQDKTTLVFVSHIEHGNLIVEEAYSLFKHKIPFVQGSMSVNDREKTKAGLINKKIKACIATTTWTEGVDIPNLDCVIMAGGGKSEIQTLQRLGRGLRKTEDKDSVIVIDFLDLTHTHLIRQTGERLATYSEQGWL